MKREVIIGIVILLGIFLVFSEEYVPGEIIVKYREGIVISDTEAISDFARIEGISSPINVEKIIPNKEIYNLKFDSGDSLVKIVDEYSVLEDVEYAEPNYIYRSFITPNDSSFSTQWGLGNIDATRAWGLTIGNESVVIAVIDTGVDWNHPDLSSNIWNNSDEDCDNSTDLDNNGYNGDCRGYDFVDINASWYIQNGYTIDVNEDYNITDNDPMDYDGHGTHVSGIANAVSNNTVGVSGVCWNCEIIPARAGFRINHPTLGWGGSLEADDVASALYYVSDNNATVISMSFGGSHSNTIQDAIDYAYDNGSILVASSGNSGSESITYPCGYDNVICVSAIDEDNTSASYSNYGSWVDLAAPGTSIYSTYFDDTYTSLSGTSMSTPMVAGGIGLIKSLFNKNQSEIKEALNNTGSLVSFNGVNIPRINIYSAILSFDTTSPLVNLISPLDNHFNDSRNYDFACNASDWQLSNITLNIWNSTGLYYNQTYSISGTFNQSQFTINNMDINSYKWNCISYDSEGNLGYASANFSLNIGNVSVVLSRPSDGLYSSLEYNEFECNTSSISSFNLLNVSFNLWSSSVLVYNETKTISGVSNSSLFNFTFAGNGVYEWNCLAYNNRSESDWGDSNNSFGFDSVFPNVSIISPSDSSSYISNSQQIEFYYNASDNIGIRNCSIIINGVVSATNESINNGSNNFTLVFSPGTYQWSINCFDNAVNTANSSNRSFSISSPPSSTTSSSGGGGGGGSLYNTYIISNDQITNGYSERLRKNDRLKFVFFDINSDIHYLIVNEIGKDYVNITIKSNPITLKLGIGQSLKINLTSSEYYDLFIKLNSIEDNKADITIQSIKESIFNKLTDDTKKDSVENKPEEYRTYDNNNNKTSDEDKSSDNRTVVNLLVLVIIILLIILLFRERGYIFEKEKKLKEYKDLFIRHIKPNSKIK